MFVEITEINLLDKLQLEKFLVRFGIELHEREGDSGYDVTFALSSGVKLVTGSDNVTLVDDLTLNFITLDRSNFLQVKIQ